MKQHTFHIYPATSTSEALDQDNPELQNPMENSDLEATKVVEQFVKGIGVVALFIFLAYINFNV
jgi:hypothetical protein